MSVQSLSHATTLSSNCLATLDVYAACRVSATRCGRSNCDYTNGNTILTYRSCVKPALHARPLGFEIENSKSSSHNDVLTPSYVPVGKCGPEHGGLACDPRSTAYSRSSCGPEHGGLACDPRSTAYSRSSCVSYAIALFITVR